jgi:hypothetical protein
LDFPLFAGDFLTQSDPTNVVWLPCPLGSGAVVLALGVAFFAAVFAAMSATLCEERGGEGGRPIDGARCDVSGSVRFSRGFLNIWKRVFTLLCSPGYVLVRCGNLWIVWDIEDGPFARRKHGVTCLVIGTFNCRPHLIESCQQG